MFFQALTLSVQGFVVPKYLSECEKGNYENGVAQQHLCENLQSPTTKRLLILNTIHNHSETTELSRTDGG
jgi:hypothetical protein